MTLNADVDATRRAGARGRRAPRRRPEGRRRQQAPAMTTRSDRRPIITGRVDDYNRHQLAAVPHCVRCAEPVMLSPQYEDSPAICTTCADELRPPSVHVINGYRWLHDALRADLANRDQADAEPAVDE